MTEAAVVHPTSWHEELQTLQKHILSEDHEQVHLLALQLLTQDSPRSLPDTIYHTVETIFCKSLLKLEKYTHVVDYFQKKKNPETCILEYAYALYRLHQYETCKTLLLQQWQPTNVPRAWMHILAQCYYRLNETPLAMKMYTDILGNTGDDDELHEVLVNALAVPISNHTFAAATTTLHGTYLQSLFTRAESILDSYSQKSIQKKLSSNDYPYDLALNVATGLLLQSTSRSTVSKALHILKQAESFCSRQSSSSSLPFHESPEEMGPIRANKAYGQFILGDVQGAMQMYLDLLRVDTSLQPPGLRMTIQHNVAVIHSELHLSGIEDVYKRLPDFTMDPKVTPNQIRIILFNRILVSLKLKNIKQCQSDIQRFKDMLLSSSSSLNKVNHKKDDKKNNSGKPSTRKVEPMDVSTLNAHISFPEEEYIWMARLAMVENELHLLSLESVNSSMTDFQATLHRMTVDDSNNALLDYALAELNFYHYHTNSAHKSVEEKHQLLIKTLENLPTTIRSRPASIATLSSLYDELGMYDQRDELMKHSSDGIATKVYLADLALSMNQFEEAVEMYQSILDRMDLNQEDELRLQCQAKRIKALSYIDGKQASKCLSSLDVNWDTILATDDGKTGDQLENLDIPRLSKSTIGTSGGLQNGRRVTGESRTIDESKVKGKEHTLERRAKQREEYLKKLTLEGKYNPDRPTPPDPERWIPKSQRSYNKRGRKARTTFVGSQGAGAGTEKDASRLDVAAKLAAQSSGASSKPSTAHLAVSTSGPTKNRRR